MLNTKFFKLILQLPQVDVKEYWKYIFKGHDPKEFSYLLVVYLKKIYPNFTSANLDRKRILKSIGNENLLPKQLSNKFSVLYKELRRFLWLKGFDENPTEVNFHLLKYFKNKGMDDAFEQELRHANKNIELSRQTDIWYWNNKQRINHEAYYYLGTEKVNIDKISVSSALTDLNEFHAITKLMYACELYSRESVLNIAPKSIQFLETLEAQDYSDHSVLHQTYQQALRMIRNRENDCFLKIKNTLSEKTNEFSIEHLHILYSYLINHCIYHVRKGAESYLLEIFELYQSAIANEALLSGGFFNKDHYLNIIDIACQLKKFDWAKNFIATMGQKLPPKLQANYINYSLGFVAFRQSQFELCDSFIAHLRSKNPFFELRVRWLQLVNQYELKNSDVVFEKLKNLRQFVRRKTILKDQYKQSVLLSLKIIDKMNDPNYNRSKLIKEFDKKKNYYYGSWIKNKLLQI